MQTSNHPPPHERPSEAGQHKTSPSIKFGKFRPAMGRGWGWRLEPKLSLSIVLHCLSDSPAQLAGRIGLILHRRRRRRRRQRDWDGGIGVTDRCWQACDRASERASKHESESECSFDLVSNHSRGNQRRWQCALLHDSPSLTQFGAVEK